MSNTAVDTRLNFDRSECQFNIAGRVIRGKRWGSEAGRPVLALHGWMDNAGSFNYLAPALIEQLGMDLNFVALDMAGHGQSDHKIGLGAYNIWQDLSDLLAVVNELGWKEFYIIGHSRGAMISTLFTATNPTRVTRLVALESIIPEPFLDSEAPKQMAKSIRDQVKLMAKPINYYANLDRAIKAREKGRYKLSRADAEALAERGVAKNEKGYYWCLDPKLLAASELKLTMAQINAFFDEVPYTVKLVAGEEGLVLTHAGLQHWLRTRNNICCDIIPGGHHMHMSEQAEAVAEVIQKYFDE
ncbi:alpha/beta fold hydrolase [Saccharophagus degradans]|uniref:Alpha/beta hydrolase fold n=1 Tax=Saccharophagus degradans (strain 2-40 / ATCC 43961 / DSM 17024) TaxID=203122 RepID=Q21IX4_SACD2|nr:alpha/beta hydrolase [Saccharophagus degradans]ABD81355.1 alpha/beta hydrolase fold [Saccharophagus degradans 2-40]